MEITMIDQERTEDNYLIRRIQGVMEKLPVA